jgi:hypothetical protein
MHFKQKKPTKTAEQLARKRQQMLAIVPVERRAQIDEKMLEAATGATIMRKQFCNGTLSCKVVQGCDWSFIREAHSGMYRPNDELEKGDEDACSRMGSASERWHPGDLQISSGNAMQIRG